jgi:myo-inositol catabolism protein IolC
MEQRVLSESAARWLDEQFGSDIPQRAKEHGLKVAMPVEKSGVDEFDFQFGEDFGAHIEKYDPDFSKVLVRGASTEKVNHWLEQAAPVDGFIGFAIGRSIWWDALKAFLADELTRDAAATQIAENYLHFVGVYEGQKVR